MAGKSLLHRIEDAAATLADRFARPPTPREAELAEQLRHDLRRMAREAADLQPFWRTTCEALMRIAGTGDPRYFMRWPPIAATMVTRTTRTAAGRYWRLRRAPQWRQVWAPAVLHPQHGHVPPFLPDPRTNAATVGHANHLRHYQAMTGSSLLAQDCIVEFGGGYGSMCRLARRLGFAGRYVIFDIPPILALQRYYLGLHGIDAEYAAEAPTVLCHSLADAARFMQPQAVLMSTWALSEMPLSLRADIEPFLDDDRAVAALFAWQHHFEQVDNAAWFDGMQQRHAAHWHWQVTAIDPANAYLVGRRQ